MKYSIIHLNRVLISKDVKRGLFYPIRIFFHSLKFENAVIFSPRDHSEWLQMHMLAKGMSESPPPSKSFFSEFITYQTVMENNKTKYKSREN